MDRDDGDFDTVYPYRVVITDLTVDEIADLNAHLDALVTDIKASNARLPVAALHIWKGLVEYAVKFGLNSEELLHIAGALGKSVLDVIVERVKKWLANRPSDGQTVDILGPDGEVVRVVKNGQRDTNLA